MIFICLHTPISVRMVTLMKRYVPCPKRQLEQLALKRVAVLNLNVNSELPQSHLEAGDLTHSEDRLWQIR